MRSRQSEGAGFIPNAADALSLPAMFGWGFVLTQCRPRRLAKQALVFRFRNAVSIARNANQTVAIDDVNGAAIGAD